MVTSHDRLDTTLSVGFVDLVGFTTASATMQPVELLEFMRNFHSRAFDVVTTRGGRVVKHIGDEIMFTVGDPVPACDIALSLIESFDVGDATTAGGVAHGSVIARHGDYYGTIVNLAARLVDTAVPGEVLADAGVGRPSSAAGRRRVPGSPSSPPAAACSRASPTPSASCRSAAARPDLTGPDRTRPRRPARTAELPNSRFWSLQRGERRRWWDRLRFARFRSLQRGERRRWWDRLRAVFGVEGSGRYYLTAHQELVNKGTASAWVCSTARWRS